MLTYIASHMGYILVTLVLILAVAAIIRSMIRAKKSGGSSCGGGCGGCPNAPYCHPGAAKDRRRK